MIKIGFVSAISSDGLVSVSYPDEDDATTDFMPLLVRRHIVGGTYRTLISVQNPLRLCRTGICRSLSAG